MIVILSDLLSISEQQMKLVLSESQNADACKTQTYLL